MIQHSARLKETWAMARQAPGAILIAFGQRLRQNIPVDYWWANNGWSFYPAVINFFPTLRCNLRCPMCLVRDQKEQEQTAKEMNLAEIKKIIDQIAFFKPLFYISGGEPLLRKDIGAIVKYAKKKGLLCSLTTNGTLLSKKMAEMLVDNKLDRIAFSLDGPQKIHDQIRGRGSFKKTLAGIKKLQQAKATKDSVLPSVKMATVITGINYRYLPVMVKLAKKLQIGQVVFNHQDAKPASMAQAHDRFFIQKFKVGCSVNGFVYHQPLKKEAKKLLAVDPAVLAKEAAAILANKNGVQANFVPPVRPEKIIDYYRGQLWPQAWCLNCWFSTTILPNADLAPCFSYPIGSLKKKKFMTWWNGGRYRLFRQILKKEKCFPGCWRCCGLEVQ